MAIQYIENIFKLIAQDFIYKDTHAYTHTQDKQVKSTCVAATALLYNGINQQSFKTFMNF